MVTAMMLSISTVIGAIVGAVGSHLGARRVERLLEAERHLAAALSDVGALHAVETAMAEEIARLGGGKSALAVKRRVRGQLRAAGVGTPSRDASAARADARLRLLGVARGSEA